MKNLKRIAIDIAKMAPFLAVVVLSALGIAWAAVFIGTVASWWVGVPAFVVLAYVYIVLLFTTVEHAVEHGWWEDQS